MFELLNLLTRLDMMSNLMYIYQKKCYLSSLTSESINLLEVLKSDGRFDRLFNKTSIIIFAS